MTVAQRAVEHVTCLGCGCACDDIALRLVDDRIVEASGACPLGASWFGDGRVPARVLASGAATPLDDALDRAARMLAEASQPLVYLAPDITCETQREGVALADLLGAALDTVTSSTVLRSVLAGQERGRAVATLGEVRNRADLLVCWGVDPALRYPRYWSRYAPEPAGVYVPEGRRSRRVVAVDVGESRAPSDADRRLAVPPGDEVALLTLLLARLAGGPPDAGPPGDATNQELPLLARALAAEVLEAKYAVIVADLEPDPQTPRRDPGRADALAALSQAVNGPTRGALSPLRAGGNRSGADAVLAWQTGYPAAVDFARGYPRYRPHDGTAVARLGRGEVDVALVIGSAELVPIEVASNLAPIKVVLIGPRASQSALANGVVVVDTGVAGIHEAGMALRMDDIPLPLERVLGGPPDTIAIARALRERIVTGRRARAPSTGRERLG
jgi:formylmethanofuran dehydrogenase subunit B